MYKIYKLSLSQPVDFAAEKLKKYLRMIVPGCMEHLYKFFDEFGKYDYELERYFDFELAAISVLGIVRKVRPKIEL